MLYEVITAVVSAISCGAEFALIPEQPFDLDDICRELRHRFSEGRDNSIIMVAEGRNNFV